MTSKNETQQARLRGDRLNMNQEFLSVRMKRIWDRFCFPPRRIGERELTSDDHFTIMEAIKVLEKVEEARSKILSSRSESANSALILSDIFMVLAEDEIAEKQANQSPTGQSK